MRDPGKIFESIEVNTEDKMWKLYDILNKDPSRKASTWVFYIGEKRIGKFYVQYLPTSVKLIIRTINY